MYYAHYVSEITKSETYARSLSDEYVILFSHLMAHCGAREIFYIRAVNRYTIKEQIVHGGFDKHRLGFLENTVQCFA